MNSDTNPAGRTMLSNKTLIMIAVSVSTVIFVITGFVWEALMGTLFVGFVSIIIYRSLFNAELETESEAVQVIERHKNPEGYASRAQAASDTAVLQDLDVELQQLLNSAFDDIDVNKMEKSNSPFDPAFTLTWKNILYYLLKGKQLNS